MSPTPMPIQSGGKGKVAKSAKGAAKRLRRSTSGCPEIGTPGIKRLAKRAGVPRVARLAIEEINKIAKDFLKKVFSDAVKMSMYSKRKTITHSDVITALRMRGVVYIGYDSN